jgi:taurine dioxygenase
MMRIEKANSGVGAFVNDVNLADLSATETAEIDAAWADHGVLFYRDQHLTPEQHLDFATRFAPADVNKFFKKVEGHPQIAEVLKEADQATNIGGAWHTDHSYDLAPARGSVLLAREVPPVGGDTLFANVGDAFDALSPGLQETLEGLRAVHTNADVFGANTKYAQEAKDRLTNPDAVSTVTHPVVVKHPQTGRKLLYVNLAFTRYFEGWTREESKPLLDFLYGHVGQDRFSTRFSWDQGSVAMWDNRSTWHWALNDYAGHRRLMHRVTIKGETLTAASS